MATQVPFVMILNEFTSGLNFLISEYLCKLPSWAPIHLLSDGSFANLGIENDQVVVVDFGEEYSVSKG
jgi:hypothetical protein